MSLGKKGQLLKFKNSFKIVAIPGTVITVADLNLIGFLVPSLFWFSLALVVITLALTIWAISTKATAIEDDAQFIVVPSSFFIK